MPIIGVLAAGGLAPLAPTIGTASDDGTGTGVNVTFTAPSWTGKGSGTVTYTATSSPGSLTGTTTSGTTINVTGLTTGQAYTFTVKATTSYSVTGPSSAASNSVTPASPSSYESIATVTVGSGGSSSADFTSIPSTYTHLQIRWIARGASSGSDQGTLAIRVGNGSVDTGTNYWFHDLNGNGASVATSNAGSAKSYATISYIPRDSYTAGMMACGVIDILDYVNTNKNKTIRSLGGNDTNGTGTEKGTLALASGLWSSTSAIDTIKLSVSGFTQSFQQYSHFALYGIKS